MVPPISTTPERAVAEAGYWFSRNPSKAWGEKFFLIYSLIWIAGVALIQHSAMYKGWRDVGLLLWGCALGFPLVVYPALFRDESHLNRRWYETYWLKMNLWIWIFVWIWSYFGSAYFFDVLGMRFNFPTTWTLDAELVGRGTGKVPFTLYLQTQAYFMTYHTVAVLVMRRVRTSRIGGNSLVMAAAVALLAYGIAYAETFVVANDFMVEQFHYLNRARMLSYGSILYGCAFIVSFPMVYRLDEGTDENWPLGRVVFESLAAGMLVMMLFDFWAKTIGPI
jgi:cycloeucalenol cycloisomerase